MTITPLHGTSYYENEKNRRIISVARKILDSNGEYAGILLIDLNSNNLVQLNDEFLKARNNYNINLILTNKEGELLYHSDVLSGISFQNETTESTRFPVETNEKKFVIMSEPTKYGDLMVHTQVSRRDLLYKINQAYRITIGATITCFIIALAMSVVFSRSITKPIKDISKSMKLAEVGDYHVIAEYSANDEMGHLVKSYNQMISKTKSLVEEVYLAEIKQKNARILALQTQINPHMIYNTFESIRMQALINGAEETAEMIKIFSRLFRTALQQDSHENTLQDEVNYLEDYIRLQNIRFDNRFQLTIAIDDDIRNSKIIALILQPLIENAIKHGGKGNEPLEIIVRGERREGGKIGITISDNGRGMTKGKTDEVNGVLLNHEDINEYLLENKAEDSQSIGLKNIAERIYLHYGSEYYIKIVPGLTTGTTVEMLLPNQPSTKSEEV